jgi:hypothetical protein
MTAPRDIVAVGALFDDVVHGDCSIIKSSEALFGISSKALQRPPSSHYDISNHENAENLEFNEDGLVIEVCNTFATVSDASLVVEVCCTFVTESEARFPQLRMENSIQNGSSDSTLTVEQMTTEYSHSSENSSAEPSWFLRNFFSTQKPTQDLPIETKNVFTIEEIAIAGGSKEDEFKNSTIEESEDESVYTDSSSQSYLYEASTVGDTRNLFFWSSSTVSLEESLLDQSTNRTFSLSDDESREPSTNERRDDWESIPSFLSSRTVEEEEEEEEEEDNIVADVELIVQERKTVTMKVSELMPRAMKIEHEEEPEMAQWTQPESDVKLRTTRLPWKRLSRNEKRATFSSGSPDMNEEVSASMDNMNLDGSNSDSTKRKTHVERTPRDDTKTQKSMQVPTKEITSFNRKNQKRLMHWTRRSPSKDHNFITPRRVVQSKE